MIRQSFPNDQDRSESFKMTSTQINIKIDERISKCSSENYDVWENKDCSCSYKTVCPRMSTPTYQCARPPIVPMNLLIDYLLNAHPHAPMKALVRYVSLWIALSPTYESWCAQDWLLGSFLALESSWMEFMGFLNRFKIDKTVF